MKLPRLGENIETLIAEQATPLEIAQLHCLRSIAVNLECLAVMLGLEVEDLGDRAYKDLLATLEYHGVGEVEPDSKEEK